MTMLSIIKLYGTDFYQLISILFVYWALLFYVLAYGMYHFIAVQHRNFEHENKMLGVFVLCDATK